MLAGWFCDFQCGWGYLPPSPPSAPTLDLHMHYPPKKETMHKWVKILTHRKQTTAGIMIDYHHSKYYRQTVSPTDMGSKQKLRKIRKI